MKNWLRSIRDSLEQIKGYGTHIPHEVMVVSIVFLVGIISFGLGRLSVQGMLQTPVTLLHAPSKEITPMYLGGEVVASSGGSRYYFPWCPGATRISQMRRVWFKTEQKAQKAGYTPAHNCMGLK